MPSSMWGLVAGVTLAVVAGVILSSVGGAGVAILIPFAAALLGAVGASVGYAVEKLRARP